MAISRGKLTLHPALWKGFPTCFRISNLRGTFNYIQSNPGIHSCYGNSEAHITSSLTLKLQLWLQVLFQPSKYLLLDPHRRKKFVAFCITARPETSAVDALEDQRETSSRWGAKKSVPLIYDGGDGDGDDESPISLNAASAPC